MTHEELENHGKQYSKSYGRSDSIWTTNKSAAYHKTILLKLLRTYGYLEPSDAAILEDEQGEAIDLELPSESEVTIVEHTPIPANKVNKLLGFEGDDEPDVEPENVSLTDTMTIESACKVENSKGVQYGKLTVKGLEEMLSALWKQVKSNELTAEATAEIEHKIKAANVVLAAKKSGEIN